MSRPSRCSVPDCPRKPAVELEAKPSGDVTNEKLRFWFCEDCGERYRRMGYAPAGAVQDRLL